MLQGKDPITHKKKCVKKKFKLNSSSDAKFQSVDVLCEGVQRLRQKICHHRSVRAVLYTVMHLGETNVQRQEDFANM